MTTTSAERVRTATPPAVPSADHRSAVRRAGLGLAAGASVWAAAYFTVDPLSTTPADMRISDLGGLAFQLGVFGLLFAISRTGAAGTGPGARRLLTAETAVLALATTWSVLHAADPTGLGSSAAVVALDAAWPLSMLGMFVIAVKVARAGVWRGWLRWQPLVAESWALVCLPAMGAMGSDDGRFVAGTHLLIGYGLLGLLLARRPDLTSRLTPVGAYERGPAHELRDGAEVAALLGADASPDRPSAQRPGAPRAPSAARRA